MSTTETRRGVVAEFRGGPPFAADALGAVPAARLELEGTTVLDEGYELTVWAHGVETRLRTFERALTTDDGVRDWCRITDPITGRTPYWIGTSADEPFARLLTGFDGVVLDAVGFRDGWDVRVLVPDRVGLAAIVDAWRDEGLTVDLTQLRVASDPTDEPDGGLTDSQHEVLVRALETGYFDVPRGTTLADLGNEFDISGQSASERLRRGMANLLAEHVVTEGDASHDTRPGSNEPGESNESAESDEPTELRPEGPA